MARGLPRQKQRLEIEETLRKRATDGRLPYGSLTEMAIFYGVSRQRIHAIAHGIGLASVGPKQDAKV